MYPLTIVADRYNGMYSGGKYLAWNTDFDFIPREIRAEDTDCAEFWSGFKSANFILKNNIGQVLMVGVGDSPEEAVKDLQRNLTIIRLIENNTK